MEKRQALVDAYRKSLESKLIYFVVEDDKGDFYITEEISASNIGYNAYLGKHKIRNIFDNSHWHPEDEEKYPFKDEMAELIWNNNQNCSQLKIIKLLDYLTDLQIKNKFSKEYEEYKEMIIQDLADGYNFDLKREERGYR